MRSDDIFFFGYGSLISEPECDEDIVHRCMGTIAGFRRVFNKRSPRRGCPADLATLAFEDSPHMSFVHDDWVDSLAVGTCVDESATLAGALVGYPSAVSSGLLAQVDAREGYDARCEKARLGYVRERVMVSPLEGSPSVEAWIYLSNPGGAYHPPVVLSAAEQARILINATPRSGCIVEPTHARGLHYLEDLRRALRQHGLVDAGLEAVAQEALGLRGPWCDSLTPVD